METKVMEQYVDNIVEELLNFKFTREEPLTEAQHREIEARYAKLGYTVISYYNNKDGKNIIRFID